MWVQRNGIFPEDRAVIGSSRPSSPQVYHRGLEGLVAGDSAIGSIDGLRGRLLYRGYSASELAQAASFEEVSFLILYGHLPAESELQAWKAELSRWNEPPSQVWDVLEYLPRKAHPLAKYRTLLAQAACHIPDAEDLGLEAQRRRPARILMWAAAIAAGAIRHFRGQPRVAPEKGEPYAAGFLRQSLGELPHDDEVRAFEASLIVQAEHGLHAAAFAALVVISTGADLGSAVLAGMGALSGARHGGANQLAYERLLSLEDSHHARRWAREALARRQVFPGFGHRVYKCPDPRVKALEPHAQRVLAIHGLEDRWQTYLALRNEVEAALGPRGIYANVDSITGLIYHPMGLPASAVAIPFCLAIQTGWMAHCLEYLPDGRLIEPGAVFLAGTKNV